MLLGHCMLGGAGEESSSSTYNPSSPGLSEGAGGTLLLWILPSLFKEVFSLSQEDATSATFPILPSLSPLPPS